MPETGRVTITGTVDNETYTQTINNDSVSVERASPSIPAAKVGQLTTRTDDNTGTLTMAASHGITDGQILDVYWSGGARYGMTVGTVSVNSVPIDGGAGDNLPVNLTAITAMVVVEYPFAIEGDDAIQISVKSAAKGRIAFMDDMDAIIQQYEFDAAGGQNWSAELGTNPLAGETVANVWFSHASSAAAQLMKATVLHGAT